MSEQQNEPSIAAIEAAWARYGVYEASKAGITAALRAAYAVDFPQRAGALGCGPSSSVGGCEPDRTDLANSERRPASDASAPLTIVTCDGCGHNTQCLIVRPTLDDTPHYQLCQRCMHNAARVKKLPRAMA